MIETTWNYPDGTTGHKVLPRNWGKVSGICAENAERHGFVKVETEVPDPPVVHEYSKLRLYDALVAAGIWPDVKTAIEAAEQWERWEWAINLATDYAPFAQLLSQLRQTYGDELTDAILAAAEI